MKPKAVLCQSEIKVRATAELQAEIEAELNVPDPQEETDETVDESK